MVTPQDSKAMPKRTIIIAEAGVNHNGDIELAKKLVDAAVNAKVDFIKFQTFKAKNIVSETAGKAEYQIKNQKDKDDSQLKMLQKLELSEGDHRELIAYCNHRGINFLSTAFDLESIDLLRTIGIEIGKIPSGEITNLPYLKKMAATFPTIIMSTGMADMDEIRAAVKVVKDAGTAPDKLILLHCTTEYPTPMEEVNLNAMLTLAKEFNVSVGYSDHTMGIEVPIAAVALGACVIEKHFTMDRNMPGPDHIASLEPDELLKMTRAIRNIDLAAGNGIKAPTPSEIKNKQAARKSIHVKRDIEKGQIISEQDLIMLRPGDGISPMQVDAVINKIASRNIAKGTKIEYKDFN